MAEARARTNHDDCGPGANAAERGKGINGRACEKRVGQQRHHVGEAVHLHEQPVVKLYRDRVDAQLDAKG